MMKTTTRGEKAKAFIKALREDAQKGFVCDSMFKCDGWLELDKRIKQSRDKPNQVMKDIGDLLSSLRGIFKFCPWCGKEIKWERDQNTPQTAR